MTASNETPDLDIAIFPGHLCNGRLFAHQIESLADVAQIHVVDLYTHDSVAALAKDALSSLPQHFVLMANSMGGAVAFEVLRQARHRVRALILIGTTCRPETPVQNSRRAETLVLAQNEDWKAIADLYAPVFFAPQNRAHNPALDETLAQMIVGAGEPSIRRQQRAFAARPNSTATLAKIDCPTLVICGREDTITPLELSEEIVAGVHHAELVVVDECGHVPTVERPELTTQIIRDWMRRTLNTR
jgi:pimeloyl-ACP methyl ester carboxylesterase